MNCIRDRIWLRIHQLALALHVGMAIGAIYKIWAASGVALTAVRATLLSSDSLTPATGGGVARIVVGVPLVELGSNRQTHRERRRHELAGAGLRYRVRDRVV